MRAKTTRTAIVNGREIRILPMSRLDKARLERAGDQLHAKVHAMKAGKPWPAIQPFDLCEFAANFLPELAREELEEMSVVKIVSLLNLPDDPNPKPFLVH